MYINGRFQTLKEKLIPIMDNYKCYNNDVTGL